jgi:hypothetical protein
MGVGDITRTVLDAMRRVVTVARVPARWVGSLVAVALVSAWASTSLAVSRPDLVVTSVSDPPESALPGDSFVVTAVVQNQPGVGVVAAPSSTTKFDLVSGNTKKNLTARWPSG